MNEFIFYIFILLVVISEINTFRNVPKNEPEIEENRTHFENAGVVTNSEICTTIALEVLNDDGSAVDAAIAALLCEGITNPQSMGVGGGFLMTIYDSKTQLVKVLNAREVAPAHANSQMFNSINPEGLGAGGLAVGVPGELMGYWEAHQKFGKIGWYDLFRPAIELASEGTPVTKYTAEMIAKLRMEIQSSPTISDLLTNPDTGQLYLEGEIMRRTTLAETFIQIAKHGPHVLYNGSLTADFLYDIHEHGGVLSVDDMKHYKAVWNRPVEHAIGDYLFFTAGSPGSGELLMYIIEAMANKLCGTNSLFWHRLIETWKFAFGIRAGMSGGAFNKTNCNKVNEETISRILEHIKDICISNDPYDYLPNGINGTASEDHGTSQICIYAPNGDAVAVTSTINLPFGAMFVSESTGIILNNEMMDFNIPHLYNCGSQVANQIHPGHYPMSSMLPTIVFDARTGKVRLIIGAAGGFKILTATSIVTLSHLYLGMPLGEAICIKRLHHQLTPMEVEYEDGFPALVLQQLQIIGHVLTLFDTSQKNDSCYNTIMTSCVNGIAIIHNKIYPVGDPRRSAVGNGF